MTLLEKALQAEGDRKLSIGDEEVAERVAIAVAYARKEINGKQVRAATGLNATNVNNRLANWLFLGIQRGLVDVILKESK